MKEEAPLGNPFIREPRGGRPAKDGGQAASPCGQSPSILSQRRRKEEWREKVAGRPPIFGRPAMLGVHSIPTFILYFILFLSFSHH
jgi:hypothetical protein